MEIRDGFIVGIFNYCDRWCETCAGAELRAFVSFGPAVIVPLRSIRTPSEVPLRSSAVVPMTQKVGPDACRITLRHTSKAVASSARADDINGVISRS